MIPMASSWKVHVLLESLVSCRVAPQAICKCIVLCCKNRGKRKDRRTTYENKDRIDMAARPGCRRMV